MKLCHSDMTEVQQKELLMEAKKQTHLLELKTLRATNPSPPLVSTLDVEMLAESDDDETSYPQQSTMAQKDVIADQIAPHQGPEEGDTREREDTAPTTQPNCKDCKVLKAVVRQLKEEIKTLKNKNPFPLRRKYERRNTVQTELPVFEKVLQTWLNHIEGVMYRQNENARQRVTRVRSWLAYMSGGGVPTMDFAFLSDPSKLINWAHSLRNFAVTTQRIYISDVRSFLKFLLEARLDTVRASKKKLKGAIFSLDRLRRKITSRLVVHKQAVKAKSKNILDAVHIQTFLEKARRAIPNALVTLEQNPLPQNLYRLFGLLSGFIICLTGHRRGVLLGMEAEEVHAAPKDNHGRRGVMVAKHKTSSKYGHALVPLEKEEHVWFARFLYHRHKYPIGESKLFFANTNGGPFSRLACTFQECWKEFGLPGKPTFGLIRTSISTYVRRELDYKQKEQVRRLMCHSTAVAEVFYEANQNLTDAFKSCRATAPAVQKQTNNPREGREEDEDMHRNGKRDKKYPKRKTESTSVEGSDGTSDDITEETEDDEDRISRKVFGKTRKTDDKCDKKYPKRKTESTSYDTSDDNTEETEDRIRRKGAGKTRKTDENSNEEIVDTGQ
ncbi:hypothetical protein PDJAM_G00259140 [Pangasius djambal]|nr:hypothetical protein [Pangasius djambal]